MVIAYYNSDGYVVQSLGMYHQVHMVLHRKSIKHHVPFPLWIDTMWGGNVLQGGPGCLSWRKHPSIFTSGLQPIAGNKADRKPDAAMKRINTLVNQSSRMRSIGSRVSKCELVCGGGIKHMNGSAEEVGRKLC